MSNHHQKLATLVEKKSPKKKKKIIQKMHIYSDGTNKYIEPIHRKNRNIDKYMHIKTYKNLHRQDEPIKRT